MLMFEPIFKGSRGTCDDMKLGSLADHQDRLLLRPSVIATLDAAGLPVRDAYRRSAQPA